MGIWVFLILFIFTCLFIDLVVLHKDSVVIDNKKAGKETLMWVSISVLFSSVIYFAYANGWVNNPENQSPTDAVLKYFTGYLVELSLSVDNLFVMAMIFKSFKTPPQYQYRVLFWGILGAIVFRALMIGLGVVLITKISWITYVFGGILIFTAVKMLISDDDENADGGYAAKIGRWIKYSKEYDGDKFVTIKDGIRTATPLAAALVMIELTDLLFAVDSIPAVLSITTDSFLVFSSNIFAILGLRSMYFFLANLLEKFKYLKYSVFSILIFVGVKLLTAHHFHIPEIFSLILIITSLAIGIFISIKRGHLLEE